MESEHNLSRLMLSPFYHHAVNSVTRPNKYVFCSQYFVDRWMPLLGGVGTQIVLFLRRQGFHNRVTGERRDEIPVEIGDIARGIGCAPRTVQYHLAENEALRRFVRKRERFEADPRSRNGLHRQCENGFQIAMDDPVHDDDLAELEACVREQEYSDAGLPLADVPVLAPAAEGTADIPRHVPPPVQKLQGGPGAIFAGGDPGAIFAPPRCKNCTPLKRDTKRDTSETLNVGTPDLLLVLSEAGATPAVKATATCAATEQPVIPKSAPPETRPRNLKAEALDKQATALAAELHDLGSERRHRQLLAVCQQHGLWDLPAQALEATRRRLASEGAHGPLERPGAYYQRILVALLEGHQVFVPTLAEKAEDDPMEVRRLARQSLGLAGGDDG